MPEFTYRNGSSSLLGLTERLMLHGDRVSPRGEATREIRNVTIKITHPDDVTMLDMGRNWNAKLAAAEALQLIGGFSNPHVMTSIAPNMMNFTNQNGEFDGAYGPRVGNQVALAIGRFLSDVDSRQVIVQVWDYTLDLLSGSNDYPCTIYFNFAIRGSSLLMTTHMRSNDVWWGWCYDLFQFTQLGWTIANYLGLELGTYTHVVDSFHLYERDIDKIAHLRTPSSQSPRLRGIGVKQNDLEIPLWRTFAQEPAFEIFHDEKNVGVTTSEDWFIAQELWRYQ